MTETAMAADLLSPTAMSGEKTGTFTNIDPTVRLSEKAVELPAGARSDLDIFLDYAARMGLTDRDGRHLVTWRRPRRCSTPAGLFVGAALRLLGHHL